jgi:hypothetical protein
MYKNQLLRRDCVVIRNEMGGYRPVGHGACARFVSEVARGKSGVCSGHFDLSVATYEGRGGPEKRSFGVSRLFTCTTGLVLAP